MRSEKINRSTDILAIKSGGAFTWGEVIAIHAIGEYSIVEYHPWKDTSSRVEVGAPSDEISFHIWIGNRDCCRSFSTLESAIVGAIAYKFDGPNTQADRFFIKAIS